MNVGRPYTEVGGEMASAPNETLTVKKTPSKIYVNGRLLDATVYNIHGNNYFMLREIGKAIDFGITWDNSTKMIGIDSDASYKE